MRLDAAVVRIRRRNAWQALDLGVLLARRWYGPLLTLWLCAAAFFAPPLAVLARLLPEWGFVLACCFVLPLLDAPLTLWAGRALFAERPGIRETLALLARRLGPRLVWRLLLYRLHPRRPIAYAVLLLENPDPEAAGPRVRLLAKSGLGAESVLLANALVTLLLTFALLAAGIALIPGDLRWFDPDDLLGAAAGRRVLFAAWALTSALMAPFHFCGGFMLYISRRVDLEAWDLELGLRNLNRRLRAERR